MFGLNHCVAQSLQSNRPADVRSPEDLAALQIPHLEGELEALLEPHPDVPAQDTLDQLKGVMASFAGHWPSR